MISGIKIFKFADNQIPEQIEKEVNKWLYDWQDEMEVVNLETNVIHIPNAYPVLFVTVHYQAKYSNIDEAGNLHHRTDE